MAILVNGARVCCGGAHRLGINVISFLKFHLILASCFYKSYSRLSLLAELFPMLACLFASPYFISINCRVSTKTPTSEAV